MYHPKIAELETGIKSLKTKILGIPIQNFKENIRGLIIDDINSLKKCQIKRRKKDLFLKQVE